MKINGSLVFDASSASEIQNLRVQKYTGDLVPAHTAADVGRAIYVTTAGGTYLGNTLYIGGASAWIAIATGGNAAALQIEVDAIETSLGAIVNSSGVFVPGQVTILGVPSTATTVTGILGELAAAISGKDALAELIDVDVAGVTDNSLLQYNTSTSKWEDAAIGAASGVQAHDAGLDSLAAVADAGIIVQTTADSFAARSLVAPAAGITITNPAGILGNPTFALANDLAALEGLTTSGYVVRTGDGTATTRSIAGTTDNVVVTNGSGVGSDTSINLATVTQGATGDFVKVTLDTFGRVTGNTPVLTADITALVDATYVNAVGDTMTGNLSFGGTHKVTSLATPSAGSDAATKAYVDSLVDGLTWKVAARVATVAAVDIATAPAAIDGVTLSAGDRVLVKNQLLSSENGIYVFNGVGSAMTRSADMDSVGEFYHAAVFVTSGTQANTGWTETSQVAVIGTDPVTFQQFSGADAYTWGVGLTVAGNTVNINLGSGIFEGPNDAVGVDLFNTTASALILTTNGADRESPLSLDGKLHLLLNAAGALAQDASGLRINAASVTNAMLVNQGIVTNADAGTNGALNLGGELEIAGTSVQGITTSVDGSVFTISAVNAEAIQKGVASFNADHFTVTAGAVALTASLDDLTNVSTADAAATGSLLQKSATDWVAVSPAVAVAGANLGDLADVGSAAPTDGFALIGDGAAFNTQKIYHLEDVGTASTTWTVTHNLGQRYCNVTVIVDDEVVIPQSIVFTSVTALAVTFNTAVAGKVVVMGVA